MKEELQNFKDNLHPSTTILCEGKAVVMGNVVDAILVRNLYGQEIVWGFFNCDKGKFKGTKLSNDAATEGVAFI